MGWFSRKHDEEQLSAYLDGELSSRQAENVEQHLSSCPACTALLDELRQTRSMLAALPSQTPRRSFVLGAEHARAPVREPVAPLRRFGFAMAPAVALSLFVALLVVDVTDFSSGASDESTAALTASSVEQEQGDAAGGAGTMETMRQSQDSATDTDATAGSLATGAESASEPPAAGASDSASAGDGTAGESMPNTDDGRNLDAEAPTAPGETEPAIAAADASAAEEPGPAPEPAEAPMLEDGSDGISTLRVLQIAAGAAFLASGFYVFVWPRLMRKGS